MLQDEQLLLLKSIEPKLFTKESILISKGQDYLKVHSCLHLLSKTPPRNHSKNSDNKGDEKVLSGKKDKSLTPRTKHLPAFLISPKRSPTSAATATLSASLSTNKNSKHENFTKVKRIPTVSQRKPISYVQQLMNNPMIDNKIPISPQQVIGRSILSPIKTGKIPSTPSELMVSIDLGGDDENTPPHNIRFTQNMTPVNENVSINPMKSINKSNAILNRENLHINNNVNQSFEEVNVQIDDNNVSIIMFDDFDNSCEHVIYNNKTKLEEEVLLSPDQNSSIDSDDFLHDRGRYIDGKLNDSEISFQLDEVYSISSKVIENSNNITLQQITKSNIESNDHLEKDIFNEITHIDSNNVSQSNDIDSQCREQDSDSLKLKFKNVVLRRKNDNYDNEGMGTEGMGSLSPAVSIMTTSSNHSNCSKDSTDMCSALNPLILAGDMDITPSVIHERSMESLSATNMDKDNVFTSRYRQSILMKEVMMSEKVHPSGSSITPSPTESSLNNSISRVGSIDRVSEVATNTMMTVIYDSSPSEKLSSPVDTTESLSELRLHSTSIDSDSSAIGADLLRIKQRNSLLRKEAEMKLNIDRSESLHAEDAITNRPLEQELSPESISPITNFTSRYRQSILMKEVMMSEKVHPSGSSITPSPTESSLNNSISQVGPIENTKDDYSMSNKDFDITDIHSFKKDSELNGSNNMDRNNIQSENLVFNSNAEKSALTELNIHYFDDTNKINEIIHLLTELETPKLSIPTDHNILSSTHISPKKEVKSKQVTKMSSGRRVSLGDREIRSKNVKNRRISLGSLPINIIDDNDDNKSINRENKIISKLEHIKHVPTINTHQSAISPKRSRSPLQTITNKTPTKNQISKQFFSPKKKTFDFSSDQIFSDTNLNNSQAVTINSINESNCYNDNNYDNQLIIDSKGLTTINNDMEFRKDVMDSSIASKQMRLALKSAFPTQLTESSPTNTEIDYDTRSENSNSNDQIDNNYINNININDISTINLVNNNRRPYLVVYVLLLIIMISIMSLMYINMNYSTLPLNVDTNQGVCNIKNENKLKYPKKYTKLNDLNDEYIYGRNSVNYNQKSIVKISLNSFMNDYNNRLPPPQNNINYDNLNEYMITNDDDDDNNNRSDSSDNDDDITSNNDNNGIISITINNCNNNTGYHNNNNNNSNDNNNRGCKTKFPLVLLNKEEEKDELYPLFKKLLSTLMHRLFIGIKMSLKKLKSVLKIIIKVLTLMPEEHEKILLQK